MNKTTKNNKKKSRGRLMKQKAFKIIGLIIICLIVVAAGIMYYNNEQYSFWKENKLRITTEFNVIIDSEKASTALNQEITGEKKAEKKVIKKVDSLKSEIVKFFRQQYNVDVSDKLKKLKEVYIYTSDVYKGQILYGYVDNKDNSIHLHKKALEDEVLMQSVFVHEVMHYLGISPVKNSDDGMYFIEGLADLLAEECLTFQNKKFKNSAYYQLAMNLWKQIEVVDTNIVKEAVTKNNYDIMANFDKRLKNIKPTFKKVKNISSVLENSIKTINQNVSEDEAYFLIVQAQDIVISYIKTFEPDKKKIKEIRKHYVLDNYEKIKIKKIGEQYLILL